jgi:hypothetical protein
MTAIDPTTGALHPRYRRALIMLAILGALSLAAVREMRIECRAEQDCLGADSNTCLSVGPGVVLATGTETRRCEIVLGNIRIPLAAWVEAIIGR